MRLTAILAAAAAMVTTPALAQHAGHDAAAAPKAKAGQSGKQPQNVQHGNMGEHGHMAMQEDMATMKRMHDAMMAKQDADPDRAFALKMIEHHRAGIAMAQTVQKHGDDAEAKRFAQKMADEQSRDIAELESWLDRHGGRTPRK
ncbi:DUF305 domain-containing protein [uncultured Phenylobacterium sp.]|uniref:DUF305 domain-containing protein n=1 Tax=uncultured Phenylobacterium sp. TaxID=349273 RepID=UPI0025F96B4D|nr:DUF305 domain-containing protein [uncultured Phenylobacterium sp.]